MRNKTGIGTKSRRDGRRRGEGEIGRRGGGRGEQTRKSKIRKTSKQGQKNKDKEAR